MSAIYMDMLTRLELVTQTMMSRFMGDRKSLPLWRIALSYGDAGAVRPRDQRSRNIFPKIDVNHFKSELNRNARNVNGSLPDV